MAETVTYVAAASQPFDIESGRLVSVGQEVPAGDLNLDGDHDSALVASGFLIPKPDRTPPWKLTGDELQAAADVAEIDTSSLKADEVRSALYAHYNPDEETTA